MKLFLETDPILKWEIVKLGIAESTVSFFSFSRNYTIWFSPPPTPSLHISASPSEWQATPASLMLEVWNILHSLFFTPLLTPATPSWFLPLLPPEYLFPPPLPPLPWFTSLTYILQKQPDFSVCLQTSPHPSNLLSSLQSREPSKVHAFA